MLDFSKENKSVIGFVGLGLMGSAICTRLQECGYSLNVIANKSRANIEKAVNAGATEYTSYKDLAANSHIIMLCMDTSDNVEKTCLGDNGLIDGVQENSVIIDFGTSLPNSTLQIADKMKDKNVGFMDAPIGRTPAHALQGKINLMCASDRPLFDALEPILQDIGENVFYIGALGAGHSVKLINNFVGMTMASAIAEAFVMADKTGVSREALYNVMSSGPLHSMMMDLVKANAIDGDNSKLEFAIKNAFKDLKYYQKMTIDANHETMMAKATIATLENATNDGYGERMVSELTHFFENKFRD